MKTRIPTLVLGLGLPALVACTRSNKQQQARSAEDPVVTSQTAELAPTRATPLPSASQSAQGLDDAQIITIVRQANSNQVDQARVAVGRAQDDDVKRFAEAVIAAHGQAVKDIDDLDARLGLPEAESQLAQDLRIDSTRLEGEMNRARGAAFDQLYVRGQIDEQRRMLDTIDNRLAPAAQREDVRNLLGTTRPLVAHHLDMAEQLLSELE